MSEKNGQAVLDRPEYIAPKEIAQRWRCGRSTVDRVAARNKFTKFCFGVGKNGMVRYLRKEVEAYEQTRRVQMT